MHIAEINIARMLAPLDSDVMQEFRDFIDPINALAEGHDGFLWRHTDGADVQERDPEPPFGDNMVIVNLSVWESPEQLRAFTYQTVHSYFIRKRQRWFAGLDHPHVACWWVEEGHRPTIAEAKARLALLEREGPGPGAFRLGRVYGPTLTPAPESR